MQDAHALTWWQQSGSKSSPPDAVFQQFADVSLARFVKPSDSAAARKELPTLKQGDLNNEHIAQANWLLQIGGIVWHWLLLMLCGIIQLHTIQL